MIGTEWLGPVHINDTSQAEEFLRAILYLSGQIWDGHCTAHDQDLACRFTGILIVLLVFFPEHFLTGDRDRDREDGKRD